MSRNVHKTTISLLVMNAAPEWSPRVFVLDLFLFVDSLYQTCLFISGLRQKVKAIWPSLRRTQSPALQYSLHTTIQKIWIEPTASFFNDLISFPRLLWLLVWAQSQYQELGSTSIFNTTLSVASRFIMLEINKKTTTFLNVPRKTQMFSSCLSFLFSCDLSGMRFARSVHSKEG